MDFPSTDVLAELFPPIVQVPKPIFGRVTRFTVSYFMGVIIARKVKKMDNGEWIMDVNLEVYERVERAEAGYAMIHASYLRRIYDA
jgi:hypothetical protein